MTWVKIDDHFDEHPKLAQVGPLGWGVWAAGLAYCNRNLTDGFIPRPVAMTLASFEVVDSDGRLWKLARTSGMVGEDIDMPWVIDLLVQAGLWEEVPGGYMVHDYADYQPTKEEVEAERQAKREAGRKGGRASAQARAQARGQTGAQAPAQAGAQAKSKPDPVPEEDDDDDDARARAEAPQGAAPDPKRADGAVPLGPRLGVDVIEPPEDLREIAEAYFTATGRVLAPGQDVQHVREALTFATVEQVVRAVRRGAERYRPAYEGDRIRSFGYFVPIVREVVAEDEALRGIGPPPKAPTAVRKPQQARDLSFLEQGA